jgi:hypothetical protein
MPYLYENRDSKYRKFSEREWRWKNTFSYDDHKGFSDLKIIGMQNADRFYNMEDKYGLPPDGILGFCTAFSMNNKRNRQVQRLLCPNKCYWNPQPCFLEKSHSGNLTDLMKKSFHDLFNPFFKSQFSKSKTSKIDWSLTGGVGHYPSQGLKKLLEGLGISTILSYDDNEYAINFDNLSREFRDSDPVRPLYIMEEKKCHDIIEALLNVNCDAIETNRNEMQSLYNESYHAYGPLREPILSLMMWGPAANLRTLDTQQKCKLEDYYSNIHVCGNFNDKHYWMYSHGEQVKCNQGLIKDLHGPAMTLDMKVIYPCNNFGCNHDCLCPFCLNSKNCPKDSHKEHIESFDQECNIQKTAQCQEHWVKHPENFNEKEDVIVDKNVFYHNEDLVKEPRRYSVEKLKFAGIPKMCITCCGNVEIHLKKHKVIHLQCKFCLHQQRTAFNKKLWEKVCNICDKIIPDISRRQMYFHKKTHSADWTCDDCDIEFNRKWNLKRHLIEIHGLHLHDIDVYSETDDTDESNANETEISEDDEIPPPQFICTFCSKEFTLQRYLDTHVQSNHQLQSFTCSICPSKFNQKKNLKRHEETVHGQQPKDVLNLTGKKKTFSCSICNEKFNRQDNLDRHLTDHTLQKHSCDICGKSYTRKDTLKKHINVAHMNREPKFSCRFCDKEFDRKWSYIRHERKCIHGKPTVIDK